MNFSIWLAFFVTATVASFVPGPAVLYVVGQGTCLVGAGVGLAFVHPA